MNNYFDEILIATYEQEQLARQKAARESFTRAWAAWPVPSIPMLLHCEPYPFENLESLMFRAAERNALGSISGLYRALDLPEGKPLTVKRHRQLSACLGSDFEAIAHMVPTEIDRNTIMLGQHRLTDKHLALTTSRLCPQCVATHGYGRLYWQLAPFAVCEEHGVYLIDHCTCPTTTRLNSARPEYATCRCTGDLRLAPTMSATKAAYALSRTIAQLFKREAPSELDFSSQCTLKLPKGIDLSGLLDLIAFLGALQGDPKAMALQLGRPRVSMNAVIGPFEKAAMALSNWPHGLFQVLRSARKPAFSTPSRKSVAASLNHVLEAAVRELRPDLSSWFLDGLGAFLSSPGEWANRQVVTKERA